ncbi:hypothetical protein CC80DRAFT_507577 [Byssothecium circinans]|uniref:Uncharacterized protein n=1 Tax=Byssothecium circinans TaxID=147558 RepID=A0A6A5TLL8_9PLEO|nr:hypothetical protein CC80DRAFT_507577 [Byssothecium circinans]
MFIKEASAFRIAAYVMGLNYRYKGLCRLYYLTLSQCAHFPKVQELPTENTSQGEPMEGVQIEEDIIESIKLEVPYQGYNNGVKMPNIIKFIELKRLGDKGDVNLSLYLVDGIDIETICSKD